MPINKIVATKRGKAAIAAVMAAAVAAGGYFNIGGETVPPSVKLAMETLVRPWEGRELVAYRDIVGVLTICDGDTENVKTGMRETPAGCDRRLAKRLVRDFYKPLTRCIPGFDGKPVGWGAMMISLSYNVGVGAGCKSTAARLGRAGQYRASCEAATAFNKAGGKVINGLVKRREMGDALRIGEAELCVSALP
jgi:lysozyme